MERFGEGKVADYIEGQEVEGFNYVYRAIVASVIFKIADKEICVRA
jgi:hypothetical protein